MDAVVLGLRVALSLAAVLALIWYIGRKVNGTAGAQRQKSMPLTVIGRQSLGKGAGIALVEVAGRVLLLGIGEQGVRVLTEIDDPEANAKHVVTADEIPALVPLSEEFPGEKFSGSKFGGAGGPALADAFGGPVVELREELDLTQLRLLAADPAGLSAADADALRAVDSASSERLATLAGLAGRAATASAQRSGSMHGSLLSPTTWRRAVDVVQQRTVRR